MIHIPINFYVGSSPRMRGALKLTHAHSRIDGIIPAYAGSTLGLIFTFDSQWDHPRVCGEHQETHSL